MLSAICVAVGSENRVKVSAVESVFSRVFCDVRVYAVKVNSGVPPQPLNDETIKGALNRAREALRNCENADMGVGIEAGLFRVADSFFDFQWCAITSRDGMTSLGCGPGFAHPHTVIERVIRRGEEIERAYEALTGVKNIGEKTGAVGFLSKNITNRSEITEMCVIMALIPFINEIYGSNALMAQTLTRPSRLTGDEL